jgi:hypothetical protein
VGETSKSSKTTPDEVKSQSNSNSDSERWLVGSI